MSKKLILLTSFLLVLALASTNVVFGAVWEGAITDDNDDAEEFSSGEIDLSSSDLEILDDQVIGLRFLKVFIPPDATIDNAYIVFTVDELKGGTQPVNCIIEGQLTPNAPTFTSTAVNISDRPRTETQALWQAGDWITVGQVDQTSNIAAVIDEIINQPGWTSGNALVLILTDDPTNPSIGIRCAEAGPGSDAPLLHIEWSMGQAKKPSPADGAIDVSRDVVLGWKAGVFAAPTNGHKVYFSGNLNEVKDGIGGITQSDASYDPGRLDFGTTYYWRTDEVNGPPDYGVYEGKIWRFTIELFAYPVENITATASSAKEAGVGPENTINGSGLDDNDLHSSEETDMWLSSMEPLGIWIEYEFDKVYKLHQMWVWNYNQTIESILGFGLRDVTIEYSTNGTDYTTLGTTVEFARAPGAAGYAHDTVDFSGLGAKYVRLTATSNWGGILPQYGLSEVRFFYIPVNATEPYPDSGATGVVRDVVLGWKAAREAAMHDVYISTDEQAVIDGTAPVVTVAETSYGPLALDLDMTHYWRVDEVNEAETLTTWPSNIWIFTTSDNIVVDDFESYNDLATADPASKRIFNVWIDGYGIATNGALVGYENPPFAEQNTVHGGEQAIPFFYSNTGGAAYSEAELTLSPGQNWTEAGVVTLAVHFNGTAGNTGQLYVKVNGSKVTYDGEASNLTQSAWQAWNIDLASFGVGLQSVTKLAIGVDGNGASGTFYFDDIGLYARGRELITPVEPSSAGLIGHWKLDEGTGTIASDSSGLGNDGHLGSEGNPQWVAGVMGGALDLDGSDDYVAIDAIADDLTTNNFTVSAWIKTTQMGDGTVIGSNTTGSGHDFIFGVDQGLLLVEADSTNRYPPKISDNQWHHIAYARDGDIAYAYTDGILVGTETPSGNPAGQARWSIGQEWDSGPSDEYRGMVDDVSFYNYALSGAEVAWVMGHTQPFDKPF